MHYNYSYKSINRITCKSYGNERDKMINLKVGICDDDMIYLNDIKSKLDQYIINNDVNI